MVALSVHVFYLCDVLLVTHIVGELTQLRPLHTRMSQVEKP